jgi:hypothetical protein
MEPAPHSSPNIPRLIKPGPVGHTACMGQIRNTYKILAGKPEGTLPRDEDLVIDGRIILRLS